MLRLAPPSLMSAGTQCVSAATRLAMLRRKMEGGGRAAVEDLRRREQEAMSLAKIEATAKRCPCCGMAIEREAGCNKMTCGNCQAFFCYRCGADVTLWVQALSGRGRLRAV